MKIDEEVPHYPHMDFLNDRIANQKLLGAYGKGYAVATRQWGNNGIQAQVQNKYLD